MDVRQGKFKSRPHTKQEKREQRKRWRERKQQKGRPQPADQAQPKPPNTQHTKPPNTQHTKPQTVQHQNVSTQTTQNTVTVPTSVARGKQLVELARKQTIDVPQQTGNKPSKLTKVEAQSTRNQSLVTCSYEWQNWTRNIW